MLEIEGFESRIATLQPVEGAGDRIRRAELRALVDSFLPSITDAEFEALFHSQEDLQAQQERLAELLDEHIISELEYARCLNVEAGWFLRRTEALLGQDRSRALFQSSSGDESLVVTAENMTRVPERVDPAPIESVDLINRYHAVAAEQRHVIRSLKSVNPQQCTMITRLQWAPGSRYKALVYAIGAAEDAYQSGHIGKSIEQARGVIKAVSPLATVSDTPLYLVAWAHHIEGRGYEATSDWTQAAEHYRSSLAIKLHLQDWLPSLVTMATEIKLGVVESVLCPIEAVTRLSRVGQVLESEPRLQRQNLRLYTNLLVDSYVGLAEAYAQLRNPEMATREAKRALPLARRLSDMVGEVRIIFVLSQVSSVTRSQARKRIHTVLKREGGAAARQHPRVMHILSELATSDHEAKAEA